MRYHLRRDGPPIETFIISYFAGNIGSSPADRV